MILTVRGEDSISHHARSKLLCVMLMNEPLRGSHFASRNDQQKRPTFGESFLLVTHVRGTWKAVIEDLIRLGELLDEEADNV